VHSSWTLNWILQGAPQATESQHFPAELLHGPPPTGQWFAAVCCKNRVLCTTAVSCTDSGCWLTPPLVFEEPAELLITFLLQQLRSLLAEVHAGQILLLTKAEDRNQPLQSCLTTVGFQQLATIAEFQLTAEADPGNAWHPPLGSDVDVFRLQAEVPVLPQDRLVALQSLINAAAADSMDLKRLPTPLFRQQWQEWQQASATVLAATAPDGQYAGLCVLAADADADGSHTTDNARQKILWLAVRPEYRRMGTGAGLVKAAEKFTAALTPPGRPVRLAVEVDLENAPAVRLYSRCGFCRSDQTLELWGD